MDEAATVGACAEGCDPVVAGAGATAAAAAAAYRTGKGAGRIVGLSRPALSILAIGFCSKFGGGGGFAAVKALVFLRPETCLVLLTFCYYRGF